MRPKPTPHPTAQALTEMLKTAIERGVWLGFIDAIAEPEVSAFLLRRESAGAPPLPTPAELEALASTLRARVREVAAVGNRKLVPAVRSLVALWDEIGTAGPSNPDTDRKYVRAMDAHVDAVRAALDEITRPPAGDAVKSLPPRGA